MKHFFTAILSIISLTLGACSNNEDVYNRMPSEIEKFVAQYYPNTQVESFTETDVSYRLILKDGPTITFGKTCLWEDVNGNGSVIVQNFLFNELPPEVYEYLQGTDELNEVFTVSRNSKTYTIGLLDQTLTYDISTGQISGK